MDARRQDAGLSAAQFLPVATLQVCNGATHGNRRPWNFPKIKSEMGGSRERGFAYYNDQGNNAGIVQIPAVPSSSSKFRIYTVGPDTQRVTFSSAQNRYFSEQVCDEVFP